MKRLDDAKQECKIGLDLVQGTFPQMLKRIETFLAYTGDDKEGVRKLLPGLEANLGEPLAASASEIAGYHIYLGDVETGFEWLERSYSIKESQLTEIGFDEIFDGVRNDQRYRNLLKRLGLQPPAPILAT